LVPQSEGARTVPASMLQVRHKGSRSHTHVYPQMERVISARIPQTQSIAALWLILICVPPLGEEEAELLRMSWLIYRGGMTVTHPGTNRARR